MHEFIHHSMVFIMGRAIQSELDEEDFELLSKICLEKNLSKRDAIRIAVKNWLREQLPLPRNDPLFAFEAKDVPQSAPARRIDEVLYKQREESN